MTDLVAVVVLCASFCGSLGLWISSSEFLTTSRVVARCRRAETYEDRIAFLKRAEAGGFYGFHLAEHHGHELSISPTAAVFLAALARETTQLKLIPTVVCLPLHHPVRVFEDLAMLDVLSHGRLELGVGKGITPYEHLQFGHPPEEASARSKDIFAMLLNGWETGIISSEESAFYDFTELKLPFKPVQHPYPPLWTAGNVETAGRGGPQLHLSHRHLAGDAGPL